jgi:hypothetical protein
MSNVKNYGQSRVMYGAAAIRFFDDDVALFVLLHAGSAMRRDLLKPEPSIWLRDASGVRLDLVRCKLCPGVIKLYGLTPQGSSIGNPAGRMAGRPPGPGASGPAAGRPACRPAGRPRGFGAGRPEARPQKQMN